MPQTHSTCPLNSLQSTPSIRANGKSGIITIDNITIKTDREGRFCLNDLHKAAGYCVKDKPANWLQLQQTYALVQELANDGIPSIKTTEMWNYISIQTKAMNWPMNSKRGKFPPFL